MAELFYNGVQLSFISTQSVDFEPVYDELGACDYLYSRVRIACTAVVATHQSSGSGSLQVPPGVGNETAAETVKRISHLLNTPRRGLLYQVAGKTIVQVKLAGDTNADPLVWTAGAVIRDEENGPKPYASVQRVVGSESIIVSFRVEACVVDCPGQSGMAGDGNPDSPRYMSHRWTETADITVTALTKRTRVGQLVVRSSLLANADEMRGIVVPPLEPDFLRTESSYTLAADGRSLRYRFVDEEQYLMPPAPAAKAEGRFSISTDNGLIYFGECTLRLQGGKTTYKHVLMQRACQIALAKLELAGPVKTDKGGFIVYGTMTEDMMANDVTVRLRAMIRPTRQRVRRDSANQIASPQRFAGSAAAGILSAGLFGANVAGIAQDVTNAIAGPQSQIAPDRQFDLSNIPGVNSPGNMNWLRVPAEWRGAYDNARFQIGSRGSAQLLLVAAYMQDPCLRLSVLSTATDGLTEAAGADGVNSRDAANRADPATARVTGRLATVTIQSDLNFGQSDPSSFVDESDDELQGVYENYTVSNRYSTDEHTFSLPVGKKDADAAVIQTAAPRTWRRVEWTATKLGDSPSVPKPELIDKNWTIVKTQIDPTQVEATADSSVLRFTVHGCYDYVAKSQSKVVRMAAVPPWVSRDAWPEEIGPQAPFTYDPEILEPPAAAGVGQLAGVVNLENG